MLPNKKHFYLFCIALFFLFKGHAQVSISGIITDKSRNSLPGATVKVMNMDSFFVAGTSSDSAGKFNLNVNAQKNYILKFTYLSYKDFYKTIEIKNESVFLGSIFLRENSQTLSEVEIKALQIRGEQKGDTTQFKADAYKTNPDATAEDLIKKMPGVTSDNNGVKVNGETVQKVLLDGKPFFGDDPNAALKNIPSDIVDKVEIFDKMSDQSQFTGFVDGDQQKTINFVTKKGKNIGQFGRAYAGYGEDEDNQARYTAGAALNSFNATRRVSLLLLSNTINQQNFSSSDIAGAMGSSGQNSGGGGRPGGGNMGGNSSLMTAPQNGNTSTQSAGLNYSDAWGKKLNVSGSYFFNYTDNRAVTLITRNYFTTNNLTYKQSNNNSTINQNNRFNFRLEYAIDSSNKLTITPSFNSQNNAARSLLSGSNTVFEDVLLSKTSTYSDIATIGYDFSNGILFQHKFKKKGRTVSLNVATQLTEKNNNGNYVSSNNYYADSSYSSLNQQFKTYGNSKKIAPNLTYTEPLTQYTQLLISYNPSYFEGLSNKQTNDSDAVTHNYTDFNSALSNKYNSVYITQKAGLSYKFQKNKLNLSIGTDAQTSSLKGSQTFPVAFSINKGFDNILPNAMLNYRFSKSKNLRIYYRSNTNIPSISQLQNVIDISNPLQIKSGNTDLKQTFENSVNIRFGGFNPTTSRNAMIFINANYTDNYISNATYILHSDSTIQNYILKAGSQLTKPVNLNDYYNARAFVTYGFPIKFIKSNLNLNGGISYNHTPTLINDVLNYSNSYASSGGIYLGSNISQNLDFSIGYNGNYTIVKNSIQKKSDNNYFNHSASIKLNWIFLKGFVLNTDVTHTLYNGLSQNFNQNYFIWSAYLGYKFFKNKSLEAKISVFDLLNQNRSISRTVTGTYTEDNSTQVLRRYFLFTLTYTFKKFKSGTAPKTDEQPNFFPGGRPPGMHGPPPGGGG